jgi:hypothetical protein
VQNNPEKMRDREHTGATTWWMVKAKDKTLALMASPLKAPTIIIWAW